MRHKVIIQPCVWHSAFFFIASLYLQRHYAQHTGFPWVWILLIMSPGEVTYLTPQNVHFPTVNCFPAGLLSKAQGRFSILLVGSPSAHRLFFRAVVSSAVCQAAVKTPRLCGKGHL